MRPVVTQCHEDNFESAAYVTKFCTQMDETCVDIAEHGVLKPGS